MRMTIFVTFLYHLCAAAVEAMVSMAKTIGEHDDATRYTDELAQWRTAYDLRFWNASTGTYTGNAPEVQTLSSITLGAGAASASHRSSTVQALTTDIENRGNHLTVGSAGQKVHYTHYTHCTHYTLYCTHYPLYSLYTVLTTHCTHYPLYTLQVALPHAH
jgi:hypothetical protein